MASSVETAGPEIVKEVLRLTQGRVPSTFVRQFYAWADDDDRSVP